MIATTRIPKDTFLAYALLAPASVGATLMTAGQAAGAPALAASGASVFFAALVWGCMWAYVCAQAVRDVLRGVPAGCWDVTVRLGRDREVAS